MAAERGDAGFDVWGDGTATRDFVYVTDVAEGIADVALSSQTFDGEAYNLGSGRETSIREIAEVVAHAADPGLVPRFQADKPVGYKRRVMSIEHAAAAFGYQSQTTLEEGIRQTVEWLRADGDRVSRWAAEDMPAQEAHAAVTA